MNRITRSLPHYHLGMAKHLVINHVALLHCVENLTFHRLVGHRHHRDGLMPFGVECVVGRVNLLYSILGEEFLQLVVD